MTAPLNNLTDTWNNSGTTFTALKYNITDTASASTSLFIDIQASSASILKLMKNTPAGGTGLFIGAETPNAQKIIITPNDGTVGSASFTAGVNYYFDGPLVPGIIGTLGAAQISNDYLATNIISLRNSSTAIGLRVYNTTDLTSANYERGVFDWTTTSNVLTIGTQNLGTGTPRNLQFVVGGSVKADYGITSAGLWTFSGSTDFVSAGVYMNGSLGRLQIFSGGAFGFTSGADTAALDTMLQRGAAGVFQFASSGSFTANGLVATTLTSLGPTGANTTVTKWLTIKDDGGTTRYIPCF